MPILLQLAQSYSNPDSVNYKLAYLREQMEKKVFGLGELAYEDQVQLAMLGDTIIKGGYIRTELISAGVIYSTNYSEDSSGNVTRGTAINLIDGSIETPNFKVEGDNVIIRDKNNASVITPDGLKTVFQYMSSGELNGWQKVGIWDAGGYMSKEEAYFNVSIPSGITIINATLYTKSMPKYFDGWDNVPDGYYHARNLRLYKANSPDDSIIDWPANAGYSVFMGSKGKTNITSSVWGSSTWSPSGSSVQIKSGDVTNYISPGERVTFIVTTIDSPTSSNIRYSGGMQFELVVTAYVGGNV